ncbi:uncharacterized protein LOC141581168 [Saimiri boliviensis]|uniref:uncharacterized protein LOC141581168 n=1 Tax=Saimiri boliviensis TaxID=27679 RepID=UPI003D77235C
MSQIFKQQHRNRGRKRAKVVKNDCHSQKDGKRPADPAAKAFPHAVRLRISQHSLSSHYVADTVLGTRDAEAWGPEGSGAGARSSGQEREPRAEAAVKTPHPEAGRGSIHAGPAPRGAKGAEKLGAPAAPAQGGRGWGGWCVWLSVPVRLRGTVSAGGGGEGGGGVPAPRAPARDGQQGTRRPSAPARERKGRCRRQPREGGMVRSGDHEKEQQGHFEKAAGNQTSFFLQPGPHSRALSQDHRVHTCMGLTPGERRGQQHPSLCPPLTTG